MTAWWIRFGEVLDTDPRDVGCEGALAVVHVYVDLLSAGIDAPTRFPGAAEHFVACDPCAQILQAMVAAVRDHDSGSRDA